MHVHTQTTHLIIIFLLSDNLPIKVKVEGSRRLRLGILSKHGSLKGHADVQDKGGKVKLLTC